MTDVAVVEAEVARPMAGPVRTAVNSATLAGTSSAGEVVLAARGIGKSYSGVPVLRGVDLSLHAGRIHALMGENGAGKSTLVKLLCGAIAPDAGQLLLRGEAVRIATSRDAVERGIVPVHQHLALFAQLSVHENLSAFELAAGSAWRRRLIPAGRARSALAAVGLELDLEQPVATLGIAQRQLLEIARALGRRCQVLILDEPTAALTPAESDGLFRAVRQACAAGTAVLLVSHKLAEIEAHADDISVLRDGEMAINAAPAANLTRAVIVRAMLGADTACPSRHARKRGDLVLEARGLRIDAAAAPFSLEVRGGEIVGLVGLLGSGALEAGAALAGAHPARGTLWVAGRPMPCGRRDLALANGIGYVPADRTADGLFALAPAWINASVHATAWHARFGFTRRARELAQALACLEQLRLNPLAPHAPAADFSGGNQQKLLMARALLVPQLRALVVLEPTRGVDVGARALIHQQLDEAARRGLAIVLCSTDLEEVCELCDRVAVVANRTVVAQTGRSSAAELGALMAAAAKVRP